MESDELIGYVYSKNYEALKRAVLEGADLNIIDNDGRTPLMHAVLASDADEKMIRFLMNNGAKTDIQDKKEKWTALHFAAREQKLEITTALLESGARVDSEDVFGNTPLWRCITETKVEPEVVRLLIAKGANPDKTNRSGVSARNLLEKMGKTKLLES